MKIIIIGGGIGGLAASAMLARVGHDVTVLEKNHQLGGRAGLLEIDGFRFDTGPSWYLMPEVFEHWFKLMGESVNAHLDLRRLEPGYRVKFEGQAGMVDIYADSDKDHATVEQLEPGAAAKLDSYLVDSKRKYDISIDKFLYKNYGSILDMLTPEMIREGPRLGVFGTMQRYVERRFLSRQLQQLMQYSLVFLGASPYNAPALYSLMSHVDFTQGVFYPMGGIYRLIEAMASIGRTAGVIYRTDAEVTAITTVGDKAKGVTLQDGEAIAADIVISNADIHFTETQLLPLPARSYSEQWWQRRTVAPSALLIYLGVSGKIPELSHHNLRFARDWKHGFDQIFGRSPEWPDNPSLYVCAPSRTDPSVAPIGDENVFILVPIAANLTYSDTELEQRADTVVELIEREFQIPDFRQRVLFRRLFSVDDFRSAFHSFRGTALGLSHTLRQTAALRPDTKSRKLRNLYYVGAQTNPGIGLPMCLISAELVYKRIIGDKSVGPLAHL